MIMTPSNCFLYDAFSDVAFAGNVAGIVIPERVLDPAHMQALAAELGAPTTGFVEMLGTNRYRVRFFSPSAEMAMCGHVTIGVACALMDEGLIQGDAAVQETAAGPIALSIDAGGSRPWISMLQRLPTFAELGVSATELASLLGISVQDMDTAVVPGLASTGLNHLFVGLKDDRCLTSMQRNDAELFRFSLTQGIDTIGVFAFESSTAPDSPAIQLRDLCHGVGNPEESASGTTNGALISFLFNRHVLRASGRRVSLDVTQGRDMGRPARIQSALKVTGDVIEQVSVGGTATRVLNGTLRL